MTWGDGKLKAIELLKVLPHRLQHVLERLLPKAGQPASPLISRLGCCRRRGVRVIEEKTWWIRLYHQLSDRTRTEIFNAGRMVRNYSRANPKLDIMKISNPKQSRLRSANKRVNIDFMEMIHGGHAQRGDALAGCLFISIADLMDMYNQRETLKAGVLDRLFGHLG